MGKSKKRTAMQTKKRADLKFYCIMMALPVAQFCLMWIGTNFNSILLAFKQYDTNMDFAWSVANFIRVFKNLVSDAGVQKSLLTSLGLWVSTQVLTMPVSLLISYYFYKNFMGSKVFRNIFFIPSVVSGVVTVTIFNYLVDRGYPLLMKTLFDKEVVGLLVNNQTQLAVIIFYNIFYALVGGFLFYSSAMCGIDESISEAAQIDGATNMQEFRYVTLPMIFPTVSVFLVSSTATIFTGDFSLYAFFKTAGTTNLTTMGYYFVQGLTTWGDREYPYFAALGLVLTLFACMIIFPLRALVNRFDPMRDADGAIAAKKQKRKGGEK